MNPLMEKYFFGELTDSEETTLEDLLVGSEDAAWEFGQAAEEIYVRYGLPEPELAGEATQDGPSTKPKGGLKPWLWFLGVLALLLAAAYWWWTRQGVEMSVKPLEKPAFKTEPAPKKVIHLAPKAPEKPMSPIAAPPTTTPTQSWATPPSGAPDKVAGNNLKVVVHRETAGPAVVRVVDPMGVEIRRLYSGTLQAGRWGFEWDGRGADGQLVLPGSYKIEVDTDGMRQSREVNIH